MLCCAVLCKGNEGKEIYVTHRLVGTPATQPPLQRLQRRLRCAVAEDRPLNGLFGPSQLGLGDGVASGKNRVFGGGDGTVGGEAPARH